MGEARKGIQGGKGCYRSAWINMNGNSNGVECHLVLFPTLGHRDARFRGEETDEGIVSGCSRFFIY